MLPKPSCYWLFRPKPAQWTASGATGENGKACLKKPVSALRFSFLKQAAPNLAESARGLGGLQEERSPRGFITLELGEVSKLRANPECRGQRLSASQFRNCTLGSCRQSPWVLSLMLAKGWWLAGLVRCQRAGFGAVLRPWSEPSDGDLRHEHLSS